MCFLEWNFFINCWCRKDQVFTFILILFFNNKPLRKMIFCNVIYFIQCHTFAFKIISPFNEWIKKSCLFTFQEWVCSMVRSCQKKFEKWKIANTRKLFIHISLSIFFLNRENSTWGFIKKAGSILKYNLKLEASILQSYIKGKDFCHEKKKL